MNFCNVSQVLGSKRGLFSVVAFCLVCLFLFSSCGQNAHQNDVLVYAASGSRVALDELAEQFMQEQPAKLVCNYASSGVLARQIVDGARADLFVSANQEWMHFVQKKMMLPDSLIFRMATNSLVVVAGVNVSDFPIRFEKGFDVRSLVGDRIAIGDPTYVPVGRYAFQVFDSLGWLPFLEEQMIRAKDVSAVLHYVELGECDWGIVYLSEAMQSENVKIVGHVPKHLHDPIVFYVALLEQGPEARRFCEVLLSDVGLDVFVKHGFYLVDQL